MMIIQGRGCCRSSRRSSRRTPSFSTEALPRHTRVPPPPPQRSRKRLTPLQVALDRAGSRGVGSLTSLLMGRSKNRKEEQERVRRMEEEKEKEKRKREGSQKRSERAVRSRLLTSPTRRLRASRTLPRGVARVQVYLLEHFLFSALRLQDAD